MDKRFLKIFPLTQIRTQEHALVNSFFFQGLQHPFLTPAHLIALLSFAILLGLHHRRYTLFSLLIFIIGITAGLLLTRFYQTDINFELVLLAASALMGIAIAIKVKLHLALLLILASIIGISIGLDSEVIIIPGLKASAAYFNMLGTLLSITFLVCVSTIITLLLNQLWNGLILRILGSWVFASSLMVLAFMFAPKP